MARPDPEQARAFAVRVVRQLRDAGYQSLWAGGCVRDQLMGREPKDYDVATNATPDEIRSVCGRRYTRAVGAAFGVITVIGPRDAGQIDVATFRRDAAYSDGRHPDAVTFSTAEEDAQRRDFTINGLFYDPLTDEVIDYVGGRDDLAQCRLRAIGDPKQRFEEDKLRMLRAVRFATTLSFEIDPATIDAIRHSASELRVVSAERVAEELRRMLVHPSRHRGLELLRTTDLLAESLGEAAAPWSSEVSEDSGELAWDRTVRMLERLREPTVAVALAVVLREAYLAADRDPAFVHRMAQRLRLSNDEREGVHFFFENEGRVRAASQAAWPALQRLLIASRIDELLEYSQAVSEVVDGHSREVEFCRDKLQLPAAQLNPPPLVTGEALRGLGIPPGPVYKLLLEESRDAQLVGLLHSTEQALDWVRMRWLQL